VDKTTAFFVPPSVHRRSGTLFWLTNTGISSARLIGKTSSAFSFPTPSCRQRLPDELYQTPRSWAERAYPKLIHYNKFAKGGHFAAWEQPEILVNELRTAFRSLRQQT